MALFRKARFVPLLRPLGGSKSRSSFGLKSLRKRNWGIFPGSGTWHAQMTAARGSPGILLEILVDYDWQYTVVGFRVTKPPYMYTRALAHIRNYAYMYTYIYLISTYILSDTYIYTFICLYVVYIYICVYVFVHYTCVYLLCIYTYILMKWISRLHFKRDGHLPLAENVSAPGRRRPSLSWRPWAPA